MTDSPYAFWRASLAWRENPTGPPPDFEKLHPETGFYRGQHNEAVAIWWREGAQHVSGERQPDQCVAMVHRQDRPPTETDTGLRVSSYDRVEIIGDNVFSYCCRHPITHEAYKAFLKTGRWPEDPEPIVPGKQTVTTGNPARESGGPRLRKKTNLAERSQSEGESGTEGGESGTADVGHNQPVSAEGALSAELEDLLDAIKRWLDEIGGKIANQVHADKMANYAKEVERIEKRAEEAKATARRPFDDGVAAVMARFNPLLQRAENAKKRVKGYLLPWFSEQSKLKAAEEARLAKVNAQRKAEGKPPELPPINAPATMAGTRGRVALKTTTVYEVESLGDAAMYLVKLEKPPEDFVDAVQKCGARLMKAGVAVPGMKAASKEVVA